MNLFSLVLVNLGRNKLRTFLTLASVTVALFLFISLRGVLDTLHSSIEVGSRQRLITRNAISLVFPMPQSYGNRIAAVPGVRSVGVQNWFGGQDPRGAQYFYPQFAVDESFYPIYRNDVEIVEASQPTVPAAVPEGADPKLAAYYSEQTACVVGEKLMKKNGWKLGQTVTLSGTIYPGNWPLTIRAVYRAKNPAFGDETMFFQFKYLEQKGMGGSGRVGVYVLDLSDPERSAAVAKQVDGMFENSSAATRTESEQAFQAGFVSMYGNIPFVLNVIGLAVVFAILGIAANTMMMSMRERTTEFGVLKTLGFTDGTVFTLVLIEAAIITVGGGVLGALLAKLIVTGASTGFLPPLTIYWSSVALGIGIATLIGAISGLIPAFQASRLRIVDALRRVD
ncbi:MAG: FtsX-like permease family protein [Candidatus Eisenbacteria bacterium]